MSRPFELDVQRVKLRLLRMARDSEIAPDVMVAAMADVLGTTAAALDIQAGPTPIDDRLAAFLDRAKAEHRRILATGSRIPMVG